MQLHITIAMDNAAFEGSPEIEAARLLRELADKIEEGGDFKPGFGRPIVDTNGNKVGEAKVTR